MKKVISIIVCTLMIMTTPASAKHNSISKLPEQTECIHRAGQGAEDGAFTAVSMSMLGWGVVLAASITVLVIFVQGSRSETT